MLQRFPITAIAIETGNPEIKVDMVLFLSVCFGDGGFAMATEAGRRWRWYVGTAENSA